VIAGPTACARSSLIGEIPAELITNLMVIRGSINGSEPLFLIVDTGAGSSVIDRARAEQLGLRFGKSEDATTGGGSIEAMQIDSVTLQIGGVEITGLPLIAIDLASLQAGLDPRIDGILGYDLFQRYVVEFDYAASVLRLRQPEGSQPHGSVTVPIQLREQIPFVIIGLTSLTGRRADALLEFDTGQTGALTLTQSFVEKAGLLEPSQPTLAITTGALLPGQVPARIARLGSVRLDTIDVNAPTANITPSETAAGVSQDADGILGAEILRRFTVAVDYSRLQVTLSPNHELNTPIEVDMTGMSLAALLAPQEGVAQRRSTGQCRVRTVIAASPAAAAGIAAGDILIAIDGRSAGNMTLTEVRQIFRVPDVELRLTLARDGKERQVTIRTRRLI
jgi:predicted aspartyl protease